ncbi:MAG: hypothetical protein JW884_14005 [Deltaproteobacteria bacterium]|nr:hypothetical protein [Deltaproteobacteria bacterium]
MNKPCITRIIIAAAVFLLAAGGAIAAQKQGRGPALRIDGDYFDCGVVDEGSIIERTFIVKNIGDQELLIAGVEPG